MTPGKSKRTKAMSAALIGSDEMCDLHIASAPNYLLVIKTGAASALVYWTGTAYEWYQQGD